MGTTTDDLVRATASVQECDGIPVRRYGQVPRLAREGRAPVARPSRLAAIAGTTCWLLMLALAIGMACRFGH